MRILIAGGSGFIGSNLEKHLTSQNHKVYVLSRKNSCKENYLLWDGKSINTDKEVDCIVNLCGLDIAGKRWSKPIIDKIIDSRILPTQAIVDFIQNYSSQPKPMLINASAIGCYPNSKQAQNETYNLCKINVNQSSKIVNLWEETALNAKQHDISVKILRFGVVLGRNGGFIQKIMPAIKMHLGIIFGKKNSRMSWVHIDDLCRAVEFIITKAPRPIIYNVTAPKACTQIDLMQAISKHYRKILIFSLPPAIIKIIFGKMGEELLLADQNVKPKNLQDNGFKFSHITIDHAIKSILEK